MIYKLAVAAMVAFASAEVFFEEDFSNGLGKWTNGFPAGKEMGTMEISSGKWFVDEEVNKGMATTEDMRFHSTSAKLDKPATSTGKDIVLQFSSKVEAHQYAFCGGGYIKLMPDGLNQATFGGDDEYNVMFGPDLCGYDISHIHLIFTHKGKNLLKTEKIPLEYSDKNEFTHLYTAHIKPDGTYEVFFDLESKAKGNIIDDWEFPKKTIDDASDSKPTDWVDETEIDDPEDKKPDGHDDVPAQVADPDATKPEDWDDEMDGEWEPPMVDNPEFKGEWKPRQIDNPDYKGAWVHPEIDNPEYSADDAKDIGKYAENCKIGFDLWQVKSGTIFDNMMITDDPAAAKAAGEALWAVTKDAEKKMKDEQDEVERAKAEAEAGDDKVDEDDEDLDDIDDEEEEKIDESEEDEAADEHDEL